MYQPYLHPTIVTDRPPWIRAPITRLRWLLRCIAAQSFEVGDRVELIQPLVYWPLGSRARIHTVPPLFKGYSGLIAVIFERTWKDVVNGANTIDYVLPSEIRRIDESPIFPSVMPDVPLQIALNQLS